MNDVWDLQEALGAAVYHHQWMDKNLDDYYKRIGREEGGDEEIYWSRLGHCLLNVR